MHPAFRGEGWTLTTLFLKKEPLEREAGKSKQRGAEGWESYAWRGEPLLILTAARQKVQRGELSWGGQLVFCTSNQQWEADRCVLVAGPEEHIKSMYGLNADQSPVSPSGAAISEWATTSHLHTAEHHQKESNDSNLYLKKPKSIHKILNLSFSWGTVSVLLVKRWDLHEPQLWSSRSWEICDTCLCYLKMTYKQVSSL